MLGSPVKQYGCKIVRRKKINVRIYSDPFAKDNFPTRYFPKNPQHSLLRRYNIYLNGQEASTPCDYFVCVYGCGHWHEKTFWHRGTRGLFICGGPRHINIKEPWSKKFLSMFSDVKFVHPTWSFLQDYNYLNEVQPLKTKTISVITSKMHPFRWNFVKRMKKHFKDKIHFYGRGHNEIPNKWDGIAPYKYHIALENCSDQNYWTEKFFDPLLALSYPIYYGCPKMKDYFSDQVFTPIDIVNHPKEATQIIEQVMEEDFYEQKRSMLLSARRMALEQYSLPAIIDKWIKHCESKDGPRPSESTDKARRFTLPPAKTRRTTKKIVQPLGKMVEILRRKL